ncbi:MULTISPECIES: ARMT1-like domain-containing protein [unclassified Thiocapsa]|uniref:ARMT1-like domain-containing protein n=1 Tax=unclassified Thiocapsa TaxID=2641286 RepID=UPI0035AE8976
MMADDIHRLVRTRTANPDPYREAKAEATREALALLPVLRNDATREAALVAGIDRIAEIVDNGSQAPGTVLEQCAESFRERFAEAELIIAKGQANYETLSTVSAPVFFLLQAKCAVIAADLGVAPGALVVKGPTAS